MARLVQLTGVDQKPVYVNPLTVSVVVATGGSTQIAFPGGPEDYVRVKEPLDTVIGALNNGLAG